MKKKKALKISLSILIPILLLVGVLFYVKAVFLTPKEVETYSFSGYVYADGLPLEGATISCDVGTATTDSKGYYVVNGLTDVSSVSAVKDGYLIENNIQFANFDNKQIDFNGYKIFDKHGIVENNGNLIANATIRVSSKAGTFTTTTNDFGEFYLPTLAGQVSIEVISETTEFFGQTFDITNDDLVVSGTTTITGKVVTDKKASASDFALKLNDKSIIINDDLTFEVANVYCGDVLTLASDNYFINGNAIKISQEGQKIEFNCEKYYSYQLSFVSGSIPIYGTVICVNGNSNFVAVGNDYKLEKLHGNNELTFVNGKFEFDKLVVSDSGNAIIDGVFDLNGSFVCDDGSKRLNITHGEEVINCTRSEFMVDNCKLGETLGFEYAGYYVKTPQVTLLSSDDLFVELEKLYDLTLNVCYAGNRLEVNANIGGQEYVVGGAITLQNLHGDMDIELRKDGYVFESLSCNFRSCNFDIEPNKIFNLSVTVKSGDIILPNAEVIIGEVTYPVDTMGILTLEDLYLDGEMTVKCEGYDDCVLDYDVNNCDINVNMTYSVKGQVLCGDYSVAGVKVSSGNIWCLTDRNGKFELVGLSGEVELSFEKDYFAINSVTVSSNSEITTYGTYSITGKVETADGNLTNFKIILISLDTGEESVAYTDNNGCYIFENLSGEYIVVYDENTDIVLKPSSYTIDKGGVYNFADNGYSFGGVVTSGGIPVADVVVKAGDNEAITDEDGKYVFDLITKPCVVLLSKNGYVFDNNNLQVDETFDLNYDVNFTCSYKVVGKVTSGSVSLDGVVVSAQGKTCQTVNGAYEISGLTGEAQISVSLNGYVFGEDVKVCEYSQVDFNGYYSTKIIVKTGSIYLSGVKIKYGSYELFTNEMGEGLLEKVYAGDKYILSKDGYDLGEYTFGLYVEEINISTTYTISGRVVSAGSGLAGAVITVGDKTVITDDLGEFEISGLSGECLLTISKENFEFNDITINKAEEIYVSAMFTVKGYVILDGIPVSGVDVSLGDVSSRTNNSGYFELVNVTEEGYVEFSKVGYDFGEEIFVNTNANLNVEATYSISGVVATGNIKIAGARVISSTGVEVLTDSNGCYTLSGLDRVVSLTILADGYDNAEVKNITGYSNSLNVNMTYSIVIKFQGGDYNNVRVGVNNVYKTYSQEVVTIENCSGETVITYNKLGYTFIEDNVGSIICNETRMVTVKEVYSVSGTVTTKGGLVVSGAIISAGGKKAISDNNGSYTIDGLSGDVNIKASLENDSVLFEYNIGTVNTAMIKNIDNQIENIHYLYYLTMLGYEKLSKAYAYQVYVDGAVVPTKFADAQQTRIIYKKDSLGRRIIQNLNYGKKIDIAGLITVDPRVAFLAYYDEKNGELQYMRASGDVVKSNRTADYSSLSWTDISKENYFTQFGTNPDGFYPYVMVLNSVDKKKGATEYAGNTISSVENIADNGDSFTFTFKLDHANEETYKDYKRQMKFMVPEQDLDSFQSINLTYTVSKAGDLLGLKIDESYTVSSMGQSVPTNASFPYVFRIYNEGESVPDIVVEHSNGDTYAEGINSALLIDTSSVQTVSTQSVQIYKRREEEWKEKNLF